MTSARVITPRGYWRDVPYQQEHHNVTVCIGLICRENVIKGEQRTRIVVATDWRVSSILGSAESRLKLHNLMTGWSCACAGEDGDIISLVSALRRSLRGATCPIDETNIKPLVNAAMNERKHEKADEYIQGRFAISYDDFLKIGKDRLPSDVHRDAILRVSDILLGAQAIVFGFIGEDLPIMIETTERCSSYIRDDMAIIGEGTPLAQTALLQHSYMNVFPLADAIYCAYEAKRYAERVGSVGNHTTIAVYGFGPQLRYIDEVEGMKKLNKKYKKYGPQEFSPIDLSEITNYLVVSS